MKLLRLSLILCAFLALCSCGKDDEPNNKIENENAGAENYDDIAVTGSCSNITATSAVLHGYINIDKAPVIDGTTDYEMGVCYTSIENWTEKDLIYLKTNVLTGRSLKVEAKDLVPSTRYYYHTYFITYSGGGEKIFRGETLSFTTTDFKNALDADCIATSFSAALIKCEMDEQEYKDGNSNGVYYGVAYSRNEDEVTHYNNKVYYNGRMLIALTNLENEKEYYYCPFTIIKGEERYGKVKKFKVQNNNPYIEKATESDVMLTSAIISCETKEPVTNARINSFGIELTDVEENATDQGNLLRTYTSTKNLSATNRQIEVTGLTASTTYYYRPFYNVDGARFYGKYQTFTTNSSANYVQTGTASNCEVTWRGDYWSDYGQACGWNGNFTGKALVEGYDDYGFIISWVPGITIDTFPGYHISLANQDWTDFETGQKGEFSFEVHQFDGYIGKYYWKAYIHYDSMYLYGEEKTFTLQ